MYIPDFSLTKVFFRFGWKSERDSLLETPIACIQINTNFAKISVAYLKC